MKRSIFLNMLFVPLTLCAADQEAIHYRENDSATWEMDSSSYECLPEYEPQFYEADCPIYEEQSPCVVYPCVPENCGIIFAFADLLYWQAREEGLDYVVSAPSSVTPPAPPYAPDTFPSSLDDHSHYRPGFRVALGYQRKWDTLVYWTHFFTKPRASIDVTAENSPLIPLLFNTASGPQITALTGGSADGIWKLKFDLLDWELGYVLPYECLKFRPHIGLRAAWIKQTMNVDYNGVTFITDSETNRANYTSFNTNDFRGLGLRLGGDGSWNFWRCFSLFGTSGLSLLSGHFDISRTEVLESAVTYPSSEGTHYFPGTERARTGVIRHQLASAIDLSAGLGFDLALRCFNIGLSVAWEAQIWFAQNQMLEIVENAQNFRYINLKGDLSVQGLTARAVVAF